GSSLKIVTAFTITGRELAQEATNSSRVRSWCQFPPASHAPKRARRRRLSEWLPHEPPLMGKPLIPKPLGLAWVFATCFLTPALAVEPYRDVAIPIGQRVEDLLGRMTLEEKIGQMNMPCVYESALGGSIPEKTEAVQRFVAGTYLQGFGPGGGFFTLP